MVDSDATMDFSLFDEATNLRLFRKFVEGLVPQYLEYDKSEPAQLEWYQHMIRANPSNPSTDDLGPYDDETVLGLYAQHAQVFLRWKDELIKHLRRRRRMSAAELDTRQLRVRATQPWPELIKARGSFCTRSNYVFLTSYS
jgi:hypothetical protein